MANLKPDEKQKLTEDRVLLIHKAIHSKVAGVEFEDIQYKVRYAPNGCRSIRYAGVWFMAQNPRTQSQYAKRALLGSKITWGIRDGKPWILIEDGELKTDI